MATMPTQRINVVFVWFGEQFGRDYIEHLIDGFKKNTSYPLCFHCLTDRLDLPNEVFRIPFESGFPSKMKKLELFRADICPGERVVFTDLDNLIIGDLDKLLSYRGGFGAKRNFNREARSFLVSAWMQFEGGSLSFLYEKARENPENLGRQYSIGGGYGDQAFISDHLEFDDLEKLYPGAIIPHKGLNRERLKKACVLHFFGKVTPKDTGWSPNPFLIRWARLKKSLQRKFKGFSEG